MRTRYVRRRPGRDENATAAVASAVLATGVGLITFYVVRLLLARDVAGGISATVEDAGPPGE